MGFLSWLLCVILVVALVLLLFPFAFRIDFEAGERGVRALFFFFKKKVYEYEKKWKDADDNHVRRESRPTESGMTEPNGWDLSEAKVHKCVDRESRPSSLGHDRDQHLGQERSDCPKTRGETQDAPPMVEAVAKKPAETPKTEPMNVGIDEREKRESLPPSSSKQSEGDSVKSSASNESAHPVEVKSSPVVEVSSEAKDAESENRDSEKNETPAEDKKPKKEKRKLSDREFWTIILTPDFDARAFKYILKILKAVLSLFRVRFRDCFVEGIRSDYQTMGYIAAANGFLKAYPYVGDWDLRMDWCNEKELRAVGSVHLSITLLRIFCFTLETLVLAGILAFSFWRRRAHVIKTNELPQLGFIRRRILEFILED